LPDTTSNTKLEGKTTFPSNTSVFIQLHYLAHDSQQTSLLSTPTRHWLFIYWRGKLI